MIRKKICMLGAYAVGKTSLVRRFVEDTFSDRYKTTIGVRILRKPLVLDDVEITLILWDLHGDDEFQVVQTSYLRGASGYLLVADGTRAETLDTAERLQRVATESIGPAPFQLLVNKEDLASQWELEQGFEQRFGEWDVQRTSAKTGDGVEEAFRGLTRRMLAASDTA